MLFILSCSCFLKKRDFIFLLWILIIGFLKKTKTTFVCFMLYHYFLWFLLLSYSFSIFYEFIIKGFFRYVEISSGSGRIKIPASGIPALYRPLSLCMNMVGSFFPWLTMLIKLHCIVLHLGRLETNTSVGPEEANWPVARTWG